MRLPWGYYVLYLVGSAAFLWFLDKFEIIKSKAVRYFVGIVFYNLICAVIYELFLAPA